MKGSLKEYHRKRNFKITREPEGKEGPRKTSNLLYVIQKHAASRLHYDFRLELAGTLKSWAVPKGPSLDPKVKRLAVHVEDLPLEYGDFEGTIAAGQYGAGTVMVWDTGVWVPEGDAERDYAKGALHFTLQGKKLKGKWLLLLTNTPGKQESWLLRKLEDRHALSEQKRIIVDAKPLSAKTGRDLDAIADAGETWQSHRSASKSKKGGKGPLAKSSRASASKLARATKSAFGPVKKARPVKQSYAFQLCTLADRLPEGSDWLYEIKLDGYRIHAYLRAGSVTLITRNGKDYTDRFPRITKELESLSDQNLVLDGEVVMVDEEGHTNFQLLQNTIQRINCDDMARKDLLMDIGTEKLSHLEIIGTLARMHLKPTKESRMAAENDPLVAIAGGGGVNLCNSQGNPWTADYIKVSGQLEVDLRNNIAAEARAKIVYERLINFCDDPGTKDALQFLMTREITHMRAFMSALNSMGKDPLEIGELAPTPNIVDMYFNDSTGEGQFGERDFRGPWNEDESIKFVESPMKLEAQVSNEEIRREITKGVH